MVAHRKQEVESANDVVGLDEHGVARIHHRVRRRGALTQVDDGVRFEVAHDRLDEVVLAEITLVKAQLAPVAAFEGHEPVRHRRNGQRAPRRHLIHPTAAQEQIRTCHVVAARGEILGKRPAKVSVDSGNEHTHGNGSSQSRPRHAQAAEAIDIDPPLPTAGRVPYTKANEVPPQTDELYRAKNTEPVAAPRRSKPLLGYPSCPEIGRRFLGADPAS